MISTCQPSRPNVDMRIFSDSGDSVRRSCHAPCFVELKFHTAPKACPNFKNRSCVLTVCCYSSHSTDEAKWKFHWRQISDSSIACVQLLYWSRQSNQYCRFVLSHSSPSSKSRMELSKLLSFC